MNLTRRSLLAGLAGTAGLAAFGQPALAATVATATIAEINCNWQGYSKATTAEGFDLTWATGTGSTRRYIRAQRLADLMRTQAKASLYSVIECDPQMAADLCKLMGSQWKFLGCDETAHDRNGWLYDSGKWSPGALSVVDLPGGGNRRLLQVGWFHYTGPMLSSAVTHLSSNAASDRALQIDAVLDKTEGKVRTLSADLNASSDADGTCTDLATLGPRYQLDCRGWEGYGQGVPTWHGYDPDRVALDIDYMGVSPLAQSSGKIVLRNTSVVDTLATMATDHRMLRGTVDFQTP